jgi:23S rRNA (guanosine2251-2'-O)-methyltransferase
MIIYGRNVVLEALLSSAVSISRVLIQDNVKENSKIEDILSQTAYRHINIKKASLHDLNILTKNANHQGVVAEIEFQQYKSIKKFLAAKIPFQHNAFIYITETQLSQNMGAITRTAEIAGFRGVIIPPKQKVSPEAIKTSAGAMFKIPVIKDSLFNTIKVLKNTGFFIYGIERNGTMYYKTDLTGNVLFIIGGEDKSLSTIVKKNCDEILEIPQFGTINSLNMSVATGIVIYEYIRQSYV